MVLEAEANETVVFAIFLSAIHYSEQLIIQAVYFIIRKVWKGRPNRKYIRRSSLESWKSEYVRGFNPVKDKRPNKR